MIEEMTVDIGNGKTFVFPAIDVDRRFQTAIQGAEKQEEHRRWLFAISVGKRTGKAKSGGGNG